MVKVVGRVMTSRLSRGGGVEKVVWISEGQKKDAIYIYLETKPMARIRSHASSPYHIREKSQKNLKLKVS